jgi:hypothetical protein
MRTAKGINYELLAGSPTFKVNPESGWSGEEVYLVDHKDIVKLANELWPPPKVVGDVTTIPLPRTMPGWDFLYATEASFSPYDGDLPGGTNTGDDTTYGEKYRASISYSSIIFEGYEGVKEDTIFTHSMSIGGEFMTLPKGGIKWEGETTPITGDDVEAARIIPSIEHTLRWERVTKPPLNAFRYLMGTVNGESFLGAAPETLLFTGANLERSTTTGGTKAYSLEMRFSERILIVVEVHGKPKKVPNKQKTTKDREAPTLITTGELIRPQTECYQLGWNHFYDPVRCKWRRLCEFNAAPGQASDDSKSIYIPSDYRYLFQF